MQTYLIYYHLEGDIPIGFLYRSFILKSFCVHPNGDFLTIGLLSGIQVNWVDIINTAKVNANMFHLRNWNKNVSTSKWQETLNRLITLIEDKKLRLMMVDSQYDLSNIKEAIDAVESSKITKGKVFLTSY
ncbi:hypothetical protein FAY30_23190 [Bacillus sp. S3]|nr:hypothetical protein FAY30_23190 [Bacillus sp. S3]